MGLIDLGFLPALTVFTTQVDLAALGSYLFLRQLAADNWHYFEGGLLGHLQKATG